MRIYREDIEDDLRDIENGGYEMFSGDDEYLDPIRAREIHSAASKKGMSDLDYVNHMEWLDNLFDTDEDAAYIEAECKPEDLYVETPKDLRDFYNEILDTRGSAAIDYAIDALNDMFYDATGYTVKEFFRVVKPYIGNPEAKNINAIYKKAVKEIKVWNDFCKEIDREDLCFNVELNEMCFSGEFQKMAPGKVKRMVVYGNRGSLGKKNKYNRLGERNKR